MNSTVYSRLLQMLGIYKKIIFQLQKLVAMSGKFKIFQTGAGMYQAQRGDANPYNLVHQLII